MESGLRRIVLLVALLNLGYFGVEFVVALKIGSVSLFADSVDFLEDITAVPAKSGHRSVSIANSLPSPSDLIRVE